MALYPGLPASEPTMIDVIYACDDLGELEGVELVMLKYSSVAKPFGKNELKALDRRKRELTKKGPR